MLALRLDYGIGKDQNGIFFTFGEASIKLYGVIKIIIFNALASNYQRAFHYSGKLKK